MLVAVLSYVMTETSIPLFPSLKTTKLLSSKCCTFLVNMSGTLYKPCNF